VNAIEIRGLKKTFRLEHSGAASLKTALLWWKKRQVEERQVLRGIDLDIRKGECTALIGRNGAGKSTLLSLISQIYQPSEGSIKIEGRLAPLLELGAGFHPDLSGEENVLFNGMILGLKRSEIRERLPQIVAFSELEASIDVPVRTYSSGMQARLGFSVAAHVDADILIIDEVLAVGDYRFERKCYEYLKEFRSKGGTILFVSHNSDAVLRIADRCIWLKDGRVHQDGAPENVMAGYLAEDPGP
jgi:ABC-type polysaccharide/polyol phosphate transport system ATPase subunit